MKSNKHSQQWRSNQLQSWAGQHGERGFLHRPVAIALLPNSEGCVVDSKIECSSHGEA